LAGRDDFASSILPGGFGTGFETVFFGFTSTSSSSDSDAYEEELFSFESNSLLLDPSLVVFLVPGLTLVEVPDLDLVCTLPGESSKYSLSSFLSSPASSSSSGLLSSLRPALSWRSVDLCRRLISFLTSLVGWMLLWLRSTSLRSLFFLDPFVRNSLTS